MWLKFAQNQQYPPAGTILNGLTIRPDVPNMQSIAATFDDYEILPGIRRIPLSDFSGLTNLFYSKQDFDRSKHLAEQIKVSNEINPLIVAIDKDGPYILEGAHRLGALYYLNQEYLPALVVIDKDKDAD